MSPEAVNDQCACENELKAALQEYKCTLGGGTEWYTAEPDEVENLKRIFTDTVKNCQ